jgi:hypothetical protein
MHHFNFKTPVKLYLSKHKALFCNSLCEKPRKMHTDPLRVNSQIDQLSHNNINLSDTLCVATYILWNQLIRHC